MEEMVGDQRIYYKGIPNNKGISIIGKQIGQCIIGY